jgi:hypothetical protein
MCYSPLVQCVPEMNGESKRWFHEQQKYEHSHHEIVQPHLTSFPAYIYGGEIGTNMDRPNPDRQLGGTQFYGYSYHLDDIHGY